MKKQSGLKYVRVEQKKSKYSKDIYYGVLRSAINGVFTVTVVHSESDSPWIHVMEFSDKEFDLTEASMEDVRHFFKCAYTQAEKELDGAEFDLRDKKRKMTTTIERFTEYFQK